VLIVMAVAGAWLAKPSASWVAGGDRTQSGTG
jgi:hypothetical protein